MKLANAILIFPALVFGQQLSKDDIITFKNKKEDILNEIEKESGFNKNLDKKNDLSLIEIDENEESFLNWSESDLSSEELSHIYENRTDQIHEEFEDVFAYEVPGYRDDECSVPTFEKVPEVKGYLIGRPKVVQLNPEVKSNKSEIVKKDIEN